METIRTANGELLFLQLQWRHSLYRTTEEPLTSYTYDVDAVNEVNYFEDGSCSIDVLEYEYRHTEEITIPEELFTKDQGCVWFCIVCEDAQDKEPKLEAFCLFPLFLQKPMRIRLSWFLKRGALLQKKRRLDPAEP